MADSVPERLDNESADAMASRPVSDYGLFSAAHKLQNQARHLRAEQVGRPGGDFDAMAYDDVAITGILKWFLVERGRQDLVDRLDEMNSPSGLPGVRSLPLE